MSSIDPESGAIKKPKLRMVAEAHLAVIEEVRRQIPFDIHLPQWAPDNYQLVNDIQVFPTNEEESTAPTGYIATWVNQLHDDEYFQLVALRLSPHVPKSTNVDVIEEREISGIRTRLRERVIMDRETGEKRKAPGFFISWSRSGVTYQLKEKSGKLGREELFQVIASISWEE